MGGLKAMREVRPAHSYSWEGISSVFSVQGHRVITGLPQTRTQALCHLCSLQQTSELATEIPEENQGPEPSLLLVEVREITPPLLVSTQAYSRVPLECLNKSWGSEPTNTNQISLWWGPGLGHNTHWVMPPKFEKPKCSLLSLLASTLLKTGFLLLCVAISPPPFT